MTTPRSFRSSSRQAWQDLLIDLVFAERRLIPGGWPRLRSQPPDPMVAPQLRSSALSSSAQNSVSRHHRACQLRGVEFSDQRSGLLPKSWD